jgi:mono/diheme cytochrome c family protein
VKQLAVLATAVVALCLTVSGCAASDTNSRPTPEPRAASTAATRTGMSSMGGSMTASASTSSTPPVVTGAALVGQRVFLDGTTPSGPVRFTGGSEDAGTGACANCHGKNAGGGDGPMISWSMLTMKGSTMKNMPMLSYSSPDQVVAALTTGTRPDGTKLKPAMPRYHLSSADAAAVVDYLKALR